MKKFIRKDDKAVSPVIAVILMVAITVVLAGVLWAMLSQLGTDEGAGEMVISAPNPAPTAYGWRIEIASISGGTLSFTDAKFVMITDGGTNLYEKYASDANPASLTSGNSKIYPIPSGSTAVQDNSTGNDVTATSTFANYDYCYFAYIDQDNDQQVSPGDVIHIYKDYNEDGTAEISSNYEFQIKSGSKTPMNKRL